MIELKNLKKIYNPKTGPSVKALNGVNLTFQETGMVFLLGKSGSGKSTLLNVVGGLDKYDDGEIIIKGKSSLNFSQQDFDSYRNTFIGFVFQEYNILEDFTVAQNIGLALQLQHKKADDATIEKILTEVDMVGYGKRKPNELSGGQKQRVAIARALIKDPEIIMADEPTGALDSNTGRQVFETLRKLSKNKLVIVVSHDRENAEIYGDRIIELADGIVISDTMRGYAESERKNDGLDIIDGKIIRIKKGYKLTAEDTNIINETLQNSDSDAIISIDDKYNEEFKRVARLDDKGNKHSFSNSVVEAKQYNPNDFKLIKSRLPFKESFRIGASGLKSKKIRLVLTILLSVISFAMFGLADTMASYNKFTATLESLKDSGINYTALSKSQFYSYDDYEYQNNTFLNDGDVEYIKNQLPDFEFMPVYDTGYGLYGNLSISNISYEYNPFYLNEIYGVAEFEDADYQRMGLSLLFGKYPSKTDEIAISKLMFETIKRSNLIVNGKTVEINEYNDLCGKYINVGNKDWQKFKVTAIVDTGLNEERYADIREQNYDSVLGYFMLMTEYQTVYKYSFNSCIMGVKGLFDEYFSSVRTLETSYGKITQESYSGNYYTSYTLYNTLAKYDKDDTSNYFGKNIPNKESLTNNEMLMSLSAFLNADYDLLNEYISGFNAYMEDYIEENIDEIAAKYGLTDVNNYNDFLNHYDLYYQEQGYKVIDYTKAFLDNTFFAEGSIYRSQKMSLMEQMRSITPEEDYDVVGIYIDTAFANSFFGMSDTQSSTAAKDFIVLNDERVDVALALNGNTSYIITKLTGNDNKDMQLIRFSYERFSVNGVDATYGLKNAVSEGLNLINGIVEILAKVFLYVGIGFMVFSSLLLLNFITVSISYKKRDIGVLRAVGARSTDVFGIFFNESLIIATINIVLALILTIAFCGALNNALRSSANLLITPLTFGIRQVLLMIAACVTTAAVSTFIPVSRFARKKPIDTINNR